MKMKKLLILLFSYDLQPLNVELSQKFFLLQSDPINLKNIYSRMRILKIIFKNLCRFFSLANLIHLESIHQIILYVFFESFVRVHTNKF